VKPDTGLVKFDVSLIDTFSNLLGVEESERLELLSKTLLLVEGLNTFRQDKRAEERRKKDAKQSLEDLMRSKKSLKGQ